MPFRLLRVSLRNYKRIFLLSIGIILAVSLIAGINIGVAAISRGVLATYVQNVPFDMTLVQQETNTSYIQVSQRLTRLTDVSRVEPVFSWTPNYSSFNLTSSGGGTTGYQPFNIVGVDGAFASRYNVTMAQGKWNLTQGIVLPTDLGTLLKVKPGDWVDATFGYPNATAPKGTSYWSIRFSVVGLAVLGSVAQSLIFGYYSVPFQPTGGFNPTQNFPILTSYASWLSVHQKFASHVSLGFGGYVGYVQILYRIFLNREAVINLFDADTTLSRLVNIENTIQILVGSQIIGGSYVQDQLANAIYSYRTWLQINLQGFYFFSLPVLPISWYLAMTSWYMVTSRRRQEFGLLKVRGVSSQQIFRATIQESLIIGIIGTIFGVLAGFLVGALVALMLGSPPSLAITPSALTPDVIGISAGLGIFISILAAIRPARLASRLEPTEAVKEYQGEEVEAGKPWRPTWTWGAVALGTYKMLEWILGINPFPRGGIFGGDFFVTIFFTVWEFLSVILIPLGPFLFVYGVTKIVTRSQNRLYRATALMLRGLLKDLANITARALSRNPARSSRIAFLIALTLTFGIFVNVVSASSWDLQVRSTMLQVGADINVRTFSSQFNESFVSNLTAIPGVSQVTPILTSYANTPYSGTQQITLYGINASNYLSVAYKTEDFTIGAPGPLFQKMQATANSTILSVGLANFLNLKVGDTFQISPQGGNVTLPIQFTVIGFFNILPGVGSFGPGGQISGPGGPSFFSGGSIITSISYLRKSGFTSYGSFTYLCKVSPNIDPDQEAAKIRLLYGQGIAEVDTFQGRMQQLTGSAAATSVFKFLELSSAYLFLAAVVGFAMISWANTRERLGEIAIFRARGTSRRQALQILFAESFAILLISMVIGVGTGLMSAYGLLRFITSQSGSTFGGLSLRLIAPLELWIMLIASIGGFLAAIFVPAWLSLRKTVIQTIRFR